MRKEFLITPEMEAKVIRELANKISMQYPDLHPDNTLVLMVSPDYSATAAMHVAHHLSKAGEMCDIVAIHVPYPDEDIAPYKEKAGKDLDEYFAFTDKPYISYVLVEAGVIRGGTYTWLTELLHKKVTGRVITTTLYENTGSKYQSHVVGEYYDDATQDLTFYFERENNHWK